MKLEQQVTSLEISKKLKELGVKQESYFWHRVDLHGGENKIFIQPTDEISRKCTSSEETYPALYKNYAAFTVAELGEMLPDHIHLEAKELKQVLFIAKKDDGKWMVGYSDYETEGTPPILDTEADARAKMLIYLLENKLLTPKP